MHVRKARVERIGSSVAFFEGATCIVEATELDGDLEKGVSAARIEIIGPWIGRLCIDMTARQFSEHKTTIAHGMKDLHRLQCLSKESKFPSPRSAISCRFNTQRKTPCKRLLGLHF